MSFPAHVLWENTLDELQTTVTRATFDAWLTRTEGVAIEGDALVIEVPSEQAREWLADRLDDTIRSALQRIAGEHYECRYIVGDPGSGDRSNSRDVSERNGTDRFEQYALPMSSAMPIAPPIPTLNSRYTFETFVVGSGNRLAHAATQAVAEHPAHRYNPLFIYGGVGLGKTHLLHAIGHATLARGLRVLAVSSEKFTNDLINAIRTHSTDVFRSVYRDADLLLVDDIHFIAGKESTQEEFFHTFNAVHGGDGQIVLTSDRPPQSIGTLEDRLRSRFQWGLQVDIEPPDLETRIAILRAKTERQGVSVSDQVLAQIAQAVQQNVRELEGALNRVMAFAQCENLPLNAETAERALSDLMIRREPPALGDILRIVATFYGLTENDLTGRGRASKVSEPRQIAMYLMREETDSSFPAIGNHIGGRDHTTILHGYEKISRLSDRDAKLRRDILQIRERLYAK